MNPNLIDPLPLPSSSASTGTLPRLLGIKSPHYRTQSIDTSVDAEEFQFSLWRSCQLWQKAQMLAKWTKGTWELALVGINHQYPNASPAKIRREFILVAGHGYLPTQQPV